MFLRHPFMASTLALCLAAAPVGATTLDESQSPIDIVTSDAIYDPNLPDLEFNYQTSVTLSIVDTRPLFLDDEDATIRADAPSGSTLTIGGVEYSLLQFHLHTPGEHELDGLAGQLELHLVHQAANGALAVVGQLITTGRRNEALAPYFDALDELEEIVADGPLGEAGEILGFNLKALLPQDLSSYRYSGSLTAPSTTNQDADAFLEGVDWNVLAQSIEVSEEQYKAFARLFEGGNAREVQDLNGRDVLTDVAPIPLPASGVLFLFALGGLAVLRRRAA